MGDEADITRHGNGLLHVALFGDADVQWPWGQSVLGLNCCVIPNLNISKSWS